MRGFKPLSRIGLFKTGDYANFNSNNISDATDGFVPKVNEGDYVRAGQPLISFDLDGVGRKARSLLTEIIIANVERVSRMVPADGLVEAGRDVVLRAILADSGGATLSGESDIVILSEEVSLPNPAGLHARPAAVLTAKAKSFDADIHLLRGTQAVNAKSVVAVMGLSTKKGDLVRFQASGTDAPAAVSELEALIREGCGELAVDVPAAPANLQVAYVAAKEGEFGGLSAAPGLVVGRIFQLKQETFAIERRGGTPLEERAKFDAAIKAAQSQIDALKHNASDPTRTKILETHLELLTDPVLRDDTYAEIDAGSSAAYAWHQSFTNTAKSPTEN